MKKIILLLSLFLLPRAFADSVVITSQAELSATTTSALVLAMRVGRRYLMIENKGTDNVYVKFGVASTGTDGVMIPAGGNYEPLMVPLDAVYVRAASGTQAVVAVEGI